MKGAMMVIANTVFSDEKNGSDVISTLSDVQLGAMLHDNASASGAFDKAAEKYSQVINRLGQEFENRFCDFVDLTCIAEQLSATFNVDAGQVEIEILTLQNDLHLKAHQDAPNFWCLVDTEKYKVYAQQL
ncbi:hypothetical protein F7725_012675 [Dissostichus mawsoni]|uniref:Uncharacterized protein n=1 Tax=Dissostichus mawsoni TaxID=36200 RepID=A0A7J5YP43_DISMA|nr:hypothetical protein F7725_012675 [Dissostichus mawsoni]